VNKKYNKSEFYIDGTYLYRIDGNNHKSRILLKPDEYDELSCWSKKNPTPIECAVFSNIAVEYWKQGIKTRTPQHFTIRRNKK